MTTEEKKKYYAELHNSLDILLACHIRVTKKLPSQTTVLELMTWAYQQTINPTEM